jgi:hypothetical protein
LQFTTKPVPVAVPVNNQFPVRLIDRVPFPVDRVPEPAKLPNVAGVEVLQPAMVRVIPLLIIRVPPALIVTAPGIFVGVAVTVILCLFCMTTESPTAGTVLPVQVAVVFQLPVVLLVLMLAVRVNENTEMITVMTIKIEKLFMLNSLKMQLSYEMSQGPFFALIQYIKL